MQLLHYHGLDAMHVDRPFFRCLGNVNAVVVRFKATSTSIVPSIREAALITASSPVIRVIRSESAAAAIPVELLARLPGWQQPF